MREVGKMMIVIGILFLCIGVSGCSEADDESLDLRGRYSIQGSMTLVSGDCPPILPSNTGRGTVAQGNNSFWIEECEFDAGPPCMPSIFTGTIDGRQVTINVDDIVSKEELDEAMPGLGWEEIEVHMTLTGTVTDTSQFTLTGQGTIEPGGCVVEITVTLTKM